jgi:hypothetical protein
MIFLSRLVLSFMRKVVKHFNFERTCQNKMRAFKQIIKNSQPTAALQLYQKSCELLYENILDIKRGFERMAFVGSCPHYLFELLDKSPQMTSALKKITICDNNETSLAYAKQKLSSRTKWRNTAS